MGGVPVRICASIGIALFDPDAAEVETAETMLSHADLALYRANGFSSAHIDTATKEMERAGAHFIIDSVAPLPEALRYFNARRARGETPAS